MPIYDMRDESGRLSIQLKSYQFVEQDIQTYGPIERSDLELEARARFHIGQMQAQLSSPQADLTDDLDMLTDLLVQHYAVVYKGLLVAYTGLQEPFRMTVEPRYTTSVNLDDTESEHTFTGLAGLQALITKEQDQRRKAAQDDACDLNSYLLPMVQVTVYDAQEAGLEWYEKPRRFLCYDLDGDQITRAYAQTDVSEDVLRGLGLLFAETVASATEKE